MSSILKHATEFRRNNEPMNGGRKERQRDRDRQKTHAITAHNNKIGTLSGGNGNDDADHDFTATFELLERMILFNFFRIWT